MKLSSSLHDFIANLFIKAGFPRPSWRKLRIYTLLHILLPIFLIITILSLSLVIYIPKLVIFMVFSFALGLLLRIFLLTARVLDRKERLDSELSYMIIASASFSSLGIGLLKFLELLPLLDNKVFEEFRKEALRVKVFRKWLTAHEALRLMLKYIPSTNIKRKLTNYIPSLLRGTEDLWLLSVARDEMNEILVKSRLRLNLRTQIAIILMIITSLLPVLVLSIAAIFYRSLLSQFIMVQTIIMLLGVLAAPRLPLHLKIQVGSHIVDALSIASLLFLIFALINTKLMFIIPALVLSLAVGIYRTYIFIQGCREITEVPSITKEFCDNILVLRNASKAAERALQSSRSSVLSKCKDFDCSPRSWLAKFSLLLMKFVDIVGTVEHSVLESLRDTIAVLSLNFKEYLVSMCIVICVALATPWLITSALSLMRIGGLWGWLIAIFSSIFSSIIASRYSFDDSLNTVLPTISAFELCIFTGLLPWH